MLAYGLWIPDLLSGEDEQPVPAGWAKLSIEQRAGLAPVEDVDLVGDDRASFSAPGRLLLTVERDPLRAVITAPAPVDDASLIHPLLAFVGAAAARWQGRSAFHAAAVVLDGGAWLLLGNAGSGKSTTASYLHALGVPVLADDLSVIDGATVLAGPRVGDLRAEAAERFGRGVELDAPLGRSRWREVYADVPPVVPLSGFVVLAWGEDFVVDRVAPKDRLAVLGGSDALQLAPSAHRAFLDLLPVPMWRVTRRAGWVDLDSTTDALHQLAREASR